MPRTQAPPDDGGTPYPDPPEHPNPVPIWELRAIWEYVLQEMGLKKNEENKK